MPPKRPASSPASGKEPKRQKKVMTLHEKVELLDMVKEGKSYAAVGRHYGVNESTVRYIKKNEKAIRSSVASSFCGSAKMVNVVRNKAIVRMESALAFWIQDLRKKNIPLGTKMIRKKALNLYSKFSGGNEGEPQSGPSSDAEEFKASKGWFARFVKRYQLRIGKSDGEVASTNAESAEKYPETYKKLVKKKGFKPQQAAQLAQSCPTKTDTTMTRPKPATETLSSANSLIRNDSLSHPTPAKLQKKTERQFGNQFFEEKRQMPSTQSPLMPAQPAPRQMQVLAPPVQAAPRQVQVLAPPVQVTVAKPKPVEKPRPREKRIFVVADHQRCVMSNLASLWKSGKLCDAGIGNGSSTVMVHKVVLSAVCPKLLSVFSTDILSHKFLQVNFPEEVSTEALNAFAEYMYNGILDLDRDILEQLKIIAKRLDMKEFEQLCDSHLPNHMHQPASAAVASFSNVPLIQTTMPIPPMTSSLPSLSSTISTSMHSAPSITTQVIDVKQEISEAELAQVKKDTAAVFGQESEVSSLAPNKSGNAAGFVISPSIKTEPVGPEDDKYGHLGGGGGSSSNQAFTSTSSSSSVLPTAASTSIASVPASSTEFAIPFSEATDVKSTRLKVTHSYDPPLVSDLSPVSRIVETVCSQSSPINVDSSKPLSWLSSFANSTEGSTTLTGNGGVYPVGLFTAGGDNLPLLTTETVDVKNIDLYKTDLT